MDFENLFTDFKGKGLEELPKTEVAKFLTDLFDIALYKKLQPGEKDAPIHKTYNDNEEFWKDCLSNKLYTGKTIQLKDFCLLEWLPYSPGLYYTDRAFESRRQAKYMMSPNKNEYLPLGKMNMMLGGIGSVRLAPEREKHYLCGTSTGTSHQGIPLITDRDNYNRLIDEIKLEGYCTADITGTVEVLPIDKALINYAREVPKYSISVTSIEKKKKMEKNILVSVSAIYSEEGSYNSHYPGQWSFASFSPDRNEIELKKAVAWIEQYAKRYSNGAPKILSDFDEHKSHFNSDIEFKLKNVMKGNFNEELLFRYSEKLHITINNKTIMGDNIEHNSGNIIKGNKGTVIASTTGNITVSNSFNKEKFNKEAADLLLKVADIVEESANEEAKEQFSAFKEELEKKQPKKSTLKAFWEGIASAIPVIKSSVDIYDKMKDFIG